MSVKKHVAADGSIQAELVTAREGNLHFGVLKFYRAPAITERPVMHESDLAAWGSAVADRDEMTPSVFLVFRDTSLQRRLADFGGTPVNPAAAVGILLVQLPDEPV